MKILPLSKNNNLHVIPGDQHKKKINQKLKRNEATVLKGQTNRYGR